MKKLSKTELKSQIEFFFRGIRDKTPKDIKKIKRLAASQNIPLNEKRKLFCKKCYSPYIGSKIRIKKDIRSITCEECGYVARWKLK